MSRPEHSSPSVCRPDQARAGGPLSGTRPGSPPLGASTHPERNRVDRPRRQGPLQQGDRCRAPPLVGDRQDLCEPAALQDREPGPRATGHLCTRARPRVTGAKDGRTHSRRVEARRKRVRSIPQLAGPESGEQLMLGQLAIKRGRGQQRRMRPDADDPPAIEYDDLVGVDHR